jgi:hypothetical protein
MKYWIGKCGSCGEVKIVQKSKPTSCKKEIATGERSIRRCGNSLSDLRDVTEQVQIARAAAATVTN